MREEVFQVLQRNCREVVRAQHMNHHPTTPSCVTDVEEWAFECLPDERARHHGWQCGQRRRLRGAWRVGEGGAAVTEHDNQHTAQQAGACMTKPKHFSFFRRL